ncbi:MAG TPA: DUF58 domain-containing protein [Candidatus Sulfomarinibacteraceae bacterium]|nr:DUF58 domain-containing protein [Candidatus Sulfomarinibacteraceae bacterium]
MSFADAFPGFRLRLTRWGALYVAGCVILGLAAVNTGNNALMAMLAVALGSYVVSGTWSRQVLASVEVEVSLPPEVFAGRPAVAEVELRNSSRLFPAYGLVLRDGDGRALLTEAVVERRGRSRRSLELVFERRGWHRVGPWRLEVLLPLGFFLKSKELLAERLVLVLPRLLDHEPGVALQGEGGARSLEVFADRGREGEVSQLRDYREGDDHRQLHWKQTARQQRPIVVDRQRAVEGPVYLILDPTTDRPEDPAVRDGFERRVSEIATAAVRRLARGAPVGLIVGPKVVAPVREPRHARRLLRPLAEVELAARTGAAAPPLGEAR